MQYQDRQTVLGSWYEQVEMILLSLPARAISFPLVRTTTQGQFIYPAIVLHISNYYIIIWQYIAVYDIMLYCMIVNIKKLMLGCDEDCQSSNPQGCLPRLQMVDMGPLDRD